MSDDKDKRIAEALGMCWHKASNASNQHCVYCGETATSVDGWFIAPEVLSPDFSKWEWFGKIMELGPTKMTKPEKTWGDFMRYIGAEPHYSRGEPVQIEWLIPGKYINPPAMRDKLYSFLKES